MVNHTQRNKTKPRIYVSRYDQKSTASKFLHDYGLIILTAGFGVAAFCTFKYGFVDTVAMPGTSYSQSSTSNIRDVSTGAVSRLEANLK